VIDMLHWQSLTGSAIGREQEGDIDGAIWDLRQAIAMTKSIRKLARHTAENLNYLADLYLLIGADDLAEDALGESIELSRRPRLPILMPGPRFPLLLAANLWILGGAPVPATPARRGAGLGRRIAAAVPGARACFWSWTGGGVTGTDSGKLGVKSIEAFVLRAV